MPELCVPVVLVPVELVVFVAGAVSTSRPEPSSEGLDTKNQGTRTPVPRGVPKPGVVVGRLFARTVEMRCTN